MRITNKYDLDAPFVKALEGGEHIHTGDVSVTRLMAPLQQTLLMKRYSDQVEMDASDAIWMFMGTIGHAILEGYAAEGDLTEELMAIHVNPAGEVVPIEVKTAQAMVAAPHTGIVISGKVDRYTEGELVDWKLTKVWGHIYGSRIEEWTTQLSIYGEMLRLHGHAVKGGHITEFLIDHMKGKTQQHDYPDRGVYKIPIKLWSSADTQRWLIARVERYLRYLEVPDGELPPCSAEERWARPSKWAVYKNKVVKRAARLLDSKEEALEYIESNKIKLGPKPVIRFRPGESTRCEKYCLVAPWCQQRKEELAEEEADE